MADNGEVTFNAVWERGVVEVGVRPPLTIAPVKMDIPIVDFMEFAAKMSLDMCRIQREMATKIARNNGILKA